MDIWVERTEDNYRKIQQAFYDFGMPVFDMTMDNFLAHPVWDVFTFGVPPVAIDLMVSVKGLDFETSYKNSILKTEGEIEIRTLHLNQLLEAKRHSNRPKDLDDIENLKKNI